MTGRPAAGLWGPPFTGGHDFCEVNYEHTGYVCETWNTASSLLIVYAGLAGALQARRQRLPAPCVVVASMIGVIGLGSCLFHGTLTRAGQVLDELVMVWVSLSAHWALLRVSGQGSGRCLVSGLRDSAGCDAPPAEGGPCFVDACFGALAVAGTAVYFAVDFAYFVVLYVVCILWLGTSVFRLVFGGAGGGARGPSPNLRADAARLALQCVLIYCGGFLFLWVPTEIFCAPLRAWYGGLSGPVSSVDWFRYTHAVFHLTSSLGPIAFLQLLAWQHHTKNGVRAVLQRRSLAFLGMDAVVATAKHRHE